MTSSKRLSCGCIVLSSIFLCFISCQAKQPKAQNQTAGKAAATATSPAAAVKTETAKAPAGTNNKIIVYYFYNSMRCPTCYKLENYAKSGVESGFADAIKAGRLEWKSVNVDDKVNEHFVNDYKLYSKSVIVSTVKDGKESSWKNLDKIWEMVREEGKYREYIRNEVKACLEGKCL